MNRNETERNLGEVKPFSIIECVFSVYLCGNFSLKEEAELNVRTHNGLAWATFALTN